MRCPAVEVTAESHACASGKQILPEALPLHHLEEDAHPFVVILQPLGAPVEQSVGIQGGGIHQGDGAGEGFQVFARGGLVGDKNTLVFPGEGSAEVILQQAGRAYDERAFSHGSEELFQFLEDVRGKTSFFVFLLDLLELAAHCIFIFVFLVVPVHQVVERHEGVHFIRADEEGFRRFQTAEQIPGRILFQHPVRQQHPGRLATDLAASDLVPLDLEEIARQ